MNLGRAQRAKIQRIARGRSDEGLRVLEGPKAVRDALEGGFVSELWLRADLEPGMRDDLVARSAEGGVRVGEGTRRDFEQLTHTVNSQGVLALVRDTVSPLDEVLALPGLLLWLDGVQDPGNVGAVVRVSAAFGLAGLLVGAGTADPLGLKALRASAGLALRLPFARAGASSIVDGCRSADRPVWILESDADDVLSIGERPERLVLAVGAEGGGIGARARAVARRRVGIPLAPNVDSLNAAVAAGIAVCHLTRITR